MTMMISYPSAPIGNWIMQYWLYFRIIEAKIIYSGDYFSSSLVVGVVRATILQRLVLGFSLMKLYNFIENKFLFQFFSQNSSLHQWKWKEILLFSRFVYNSWNDVFIKKKQFTFVIRLARPTWSQQGIFGFF